MLSYSELLPLFETKFREAMQFQAYPPSLYTPCQNMMRMGGKRVRPILLLMANELFGNISPDAWHAAFAIEVFHNFTLVHDDIMDNAPLRRGTPTIHVQYNMPTAILAGDVLCIYAYRQLAHIGNPQHLKAIYPVFNETAIQVCEGQQMDMDFEAQPNTTLSDYITMITLKTSVLLACALKIGALLGGSLAYNAQKLYEFGKCLGIAFQLQDDYLDSFGAMELTGKKTGGDINANKKTYLLTHALNHANSAQLDTLKSLHPQTGEEKINHITHLFRQTGADTACLAEVKQYTATALQALEQVAIPAARKATLFQFANMLLNREG